ncbi:MAG: single-stranded DNA-binding protein [Corynebacterium sp.]|uniref:single-stranded DNA-binding protein n=1 Tax=Corynebacterium sp. TaxID=1720 RepID=UPI0026DF42F4|nr:single-stranded DNA-binding protein [Corynebacterium sp.]MDO5670739.1 single-stranded DNA-binding protein [Corynebacterium sp.]
MAIGDTPITVVGNVVADPELRFTPSGAAVANFRIASTPRVRNRDTNQWEDGEALFLTCNVWRQAAENVAESLSKGMRVIVNGRLKQRSYQTKEGDNRTVYEIEVDEVGPSLTFATAQVNRNPREGGGSYGGGGFGGGQPQQQRGQQAPQQPQQSQYQGGFSQQQQAPQQQSQQMPANDPWGSAPPAGGFGGAADDEPPF